MIIMSLSSKKRIETIHRYVRQNDTMTKLTFAIKNQSNNNVVVMTGWGKSKFQMRLWGADTLKVDAEMNDDDLDNGIISYTFVTTDLDTIGNYDVQLKLTDNTGKIIRTIDRIIITVEEDISN